MEYFDNRTKENIEKLIRENGDINYDSLISDGGYYYFYHLSSLRHALLDWYPFIKGDVLEVGASYGAMTGLYLKKADSVDVLEKDPGRCESLRLRFKDKEVSIICSDLFDYDADKRYDYLFLIDDASVYLEDADRILAKAKSLLKEGGTAVIGFRNRNGIKYDCGAIDEYVTEQFNTKLLIDRDDFDAKAHRHFEYVTHYYPFPDHIYTQAVFSEMCPPKGNLRDRVIPLDPFYSPLIKREILEYERAIKGGYIEEVCNFCLVFLSDCIAEPVRVEQAVLSYDRGDHSFITDFYSDGTVVKKPVTEKGKDYLEQAFRNLESLRARGLLTVDQQFECGAVRMPWVKGEGLLSRIEDLVDKSCRDDIISVFTDLRDNILLSSDEDDSGYDPDKWGLALDKAGNILKRGYIDLIPYNAFDTEKGIMYYDQEFCVEDCPANYTMYRAINYTYIHIPGLEHIIGKKELYDIFGIDRESRKAFAAVEARFIDGNRNLKLYGRMYGWAYNITDDRIRENRNRLIDFSEAQLVKRIQTVQLNTLRYFDHYCSQNGLRYFAVESTLLGAIRHGGFIPWEDALELGMPREDFDRLISLYDNDGERPCLQTFSNNEDMFFGCHARLRAQGTAAAEERDFAKKGHKGIWIDIYPLDYCSDDEEEEEAREKRITELQRTYFDKVYGCRAETDLSSVNDVSRYAEPGADKPLSAIKELLESELRTVEKSGRCAILTGYPSSSGKIYKYPAGDIYDLTDERFEDMLIPIPADFDEWLTVRYGSNYLDIPKNGKRKHKDVFIDPENSYETYDGGGLRWKSKR